MFTMWLISLYVSNYVPRTPPYSVYIQHYQTRMKKRKSIFQYIFSLNSIEEIF